MRSFWTEEDKRRIWELYQQLPKGPGGKVCNGAMKLLLSHFPDRNMRAIKFQLQMAKHPEQFPKHQGQYMIWTAADDDLIREAYKDAPWKVSKRLKKTFPDRTLGSLYQRGRALGLSRTGGMPSIDFRLTSTDAAFLAGLILGDGHVSCSAPPSRKGWKQLTIGFTNTDKALVDWIASRVPRGYLQVEDYRHKPSPIPKKKICYKWNCNCRSTLRQLVKYLRPYMIGEKQARIEEMAVALGMEAKLPSD